jgi:hypothetical protein
MSAEAEPLPKNRKLLLPHQRLAPHRHALRAPTRVAAARKFRASLSSRFDAHLDQAGISLALERKGDASTNKSVHIHFHYGLFAEILHDSRVRPVGVFAHPAGRFMRRQWSLRWVVD